MRCNRLDANIHVFQNRPKTGLELTIQMFVCWLLGLAAMGLPISVWYSHKNWQSLAEGQAVTDFERREYPEIVPERTARHQQVVQTAKNKALGYTAAWIACIILVVWQLEMTTRPVHGNTERVLTYLFGEDRRNWPFRHKFE